MVTGDEPGRLPRSRVALRVRRRSCRERPRRLEPCRASAQPSAEVLAIGKKAYRQFCGQCHALKEARAVGFGSAKQKGVGEDGGPSFNQLKVSYQMCLASVTMLFGGHEKVIRKMTWQQIKDVSIFVQYATRTHPIVAKFSDG